MTPHSPEVKVIVDPLYVLDPVPANFSETVAVG